MGLTKPRAAQIFNLDYKQSTRVVTITNINLSGGAPNSVDGVNLSLGDRVLVIGQTIGSQNGLYQVTTLGSGSNGTWARTSDGNENGEIEAGMIVMVTEGTIYADTQWKLITDDPITIGSTALVYTQNYLANSVSSGTSNVVVGSNANVTISSAGTANVLTVSSTGTVTTGTGSVTGNITGGNLLTSGLVSATGNITANYFLGNVACASGIFSSRIFNGTSEANIGASGGNANISIGGTSNVAVFATTGQFVTGLISVTGNVQAGNVRTAGTVSATGNVDAGNIRTAGLVSATGSITGASVVGGVMTGTSLSVSGGVTAASVAGGVITGSSASLSGNVTGGNILTVGLISSTGNITSAANISGGNANITTQINTTSVSASGNIRTAGTISATSSVTAASTIGGVITGSSVSVTGTVTAASTVGGVITGSSVSVTGTATAASTVGGVITGSSASLSGNVTGGNISVVGNVVTGNILTNGYYYANGVVFGGGGGGTPGGANTQIQFNDNGAFGGNGQFVYNKVTNIVTAGAFAGNTNGTGQNFQVGDDAWIGDINVADTVGLKGQQNGANGYIVFGNSDSTGRLGRAGTGPLTYAGSFSITGTVTGASVVGGVMTGTSLSVSGNVSGGNLIVTGNIVDTGALSIITGSNGNIALTPNGTGIVTASSSISTSGNITAAAVFSNGQISSTGNVFAPNVDVSTGTVFCGNIVNNNANAVGNIGSSAKYFNTVFAKATCAQYADLAEMYLADADYAPGTVVEFGGTTEITQSTSSHSTQVAGIISTNPSYLMNATINGSLALPVALVGRVPCQVVGTISKGDRLVASDIPGVATALDVTKYQPACIVGKSLENYDSTEVGVIEVAVGRT